VRNEWRVTTKPGKLFFTFFDEPRGPFELPAMKNAIKRAYQLENGAAVKITTEGGKRFLNIDRPIIDLMATVVVVEIDGERATKP
jgi:alpha-L-fucosidase